MRQAMEASLREEEEKKQQIDQEEEELMKKARDLENEMLQIK